MRWHGAESPNVLSLFKVGARSVAKRFGGDGQFRLSIVQGEKMGRRSEIFATAVKSGNEVETIMITGYADFVAEGALNVPAVWLK